jgi:1,4-alpha-glucan branching enzyme
MVRIESNWVEFVFYRPQATQVHLAGDFNGWRESELPMACGRDGYWSARMKLPTGEFRFRYCADGEWFADYAAFGVEPGPFGMDSIVRVPADTLHIAEKHPVAIAA